MNDDDFKLVTDFKFGYVSKPEITALTPAYLVKGSKNVLVDFANRIISRNGYSLFGAANTGMGGMKSSYEWSTSTAKQFPIRVHDGYVEFWWNNTWNLLDSGYASSYMEFAKVYDTQEKIDMLCYVLGTPMTYKWSGGATKIASSSGNTITKQGVLTSKATIAFNAAPTTDYTTSARITDSNNGFLTAGFAAGDTVYISGSMNNSRNFLVLSVAAGTITLATQEILTTEAAGPAITIHNGEPTWASSRFLQGNLGTNLGPVTITIAAPGVVTTGYNHGLVVNDTVQFTAASGGNLPTGMSPNVTYYVTSVPSPTTFQFSGTQGGTSVTTTGTSSGTITLFKSTRYVVYKGISYQYSGGETTDTLQGLTLFPSTSIGDPIWQKSISIPNPPAIASGFAQDLIGVQLNQLVLASTKSQDVYGSSTVDYTNFTLTSPRAPGDPFHVTMDNYATCIIPTDNLAQTVSTLTFGGGTSEFFQLSFQLSQDNSNELVRMIKLKTAAGSGLISKDAIASIKNATAYVSREPTFDNLGTVQNVDGKTNVPLSDVVKDDFDAYGTAGFLYCHVKYYKRSVYFALPALGLVLIYDLQRGLWQPPQTIPVSRFAIINDLLYGHSSITNESYQLFTGTNDNGALIPQVARFAYNNGGRRDRIKNMSQYWTDGYISGNGLLNMNMNFGFDGYIAKKVMPISGADQSITVVATGNALGEKPLGENPLGGATLGTVTTLNGMRRFFQEDTMDIAGTDYVEHFVEYTMNVMDGQFAIVAHGSNQWDAGTAPISHKK